VSTVSAAELVQQAIEANVKIATAESCTGGMVAAAITDIPGSSAVLDRGFVTYSNAAKQDMLGVSGTTLDAHGAVSEEVAHEMAMGALIHSRAGLAVSITGIAGPGGSDFKPEGRVCFGLAAADQSIQVETIEFGAIGRDKVRLAARDHALAMLIQRILSFDQ
jgi:nicotinamide-nucleotide amidase